MQRTPHTAAAILSRCASIWLPAICLAILVWLPPAFSTGAEAAPPQISPVTVPIQPGQLPGLKQPVSQQLLPTQQKPAAKSGEEEAEAGGGADAGSEGDGDGDDASGADDDESDTRGASDDASTSSSEFSTSRQKPPILDPHAQVMLDFVNKPLIDLIKYMAEITGRNFIITDDIKGEVTIISHKPVTVPTAYEAFLSALEVSGYTTVEVGSITKVVSSNVANKSPMRVHQGGNIPFTDNYVTQVIQLDNVTVNDISAVVKDLMSKDASVIAYAPANTLILTDAATNIRKIYRIINQLDIAAPRARMHLVTIQHAEATEIQKIIQELYGTESAGTTSDSTKADARRRRRQRFRDRDNASSSGQSTSVGNEGKYIEKIIADERSNSLIVLANDEAMSAVLQLIQELDVDVDPSSRAQIHVIYLKHAKAEDIAQVLSNLSDSKSSDSRRRQSGRRNRSDSSSRAGARAGAVSRASGGAFGDDGDGSATAAFDSGLRITSDESTNSLVIIATSDQFGIIRQVINQLDIRRKQVFVEAVILELASEDDLNMGLGFHMGKPGDDGGLTIGSIQMNGSSLGLSADVLSGMAVGVYGQPVSVDVSSPIDGSTTTMTVPAFGIALNALQSESSVNILSTPNILTMDNEEAKIVVGRSIPFPTSTGRDNNGQPIVSYQREDVAITLKVTPQINESNYVTLEVFQEVQEVEEDSQGLDASTAGFITSKRSAETVVVVQDNQTIVLGGLIGNTETEVETKVPILGDLPLLGALFRGRRNSSRKTNMLIFLTPHIIDSPADLEEVYRVKWAQRQEYIRRFYGKSREKSEAALAQLLQYSINQIDQPSPWRTKVVDMDEEGSFTTIGADVESRGPVEVRTIGEKDIIDPAIETESDGDFDPAVD